MSLALKILPPLALAIALSPLAAQAHSLGSTPQTVRASPITPSVMLVKSSNLSAPSRPLAMPASMFSGTLIADSFSNLLSPNVM